MLGKLFGDNKRQEDSDSGADSAKRSNDRFSKVDDLWYFKTREGLNVGPFTSKSDAQYALLYFIESGNWPEDEQLKAFIEGCELLNKQAG